MPITISSPFFISPLAVYTGKSFYVGSQDARPEEITFSSDGLKMFMLGRQSGPATVFQYTLTTPFDIGSGVSYSGNSFVVETQAGDPQGFEFSSDGLKMFVLNGDGNLYQYTLSTAFSLASGVSYSGISLNASTETTNAHDIAFSSNGLKLFMTGIIPSPTRVYEYTLSTPFSLSGASYSGNSLATAYANPTSISFNSTGNEMYLASVGGSSSKIYVYDLASPYVITSGVTLRRNIVVVGPQDTSPNGIAISADNSKLFMVGNQHDTAYQYTFI